MIAKSETVTIDHIKKSFSNETECPRQILVNVQHCLVEWMDTTSIASLESHNDGEFNTSREVLVKNIAILVTYLFLFKHL